MNNLIINFILIIIIFIFFKITKNIKKNYRPRLYITELEFIFRASFIISFLVLFVFLFRFLNLFRERSVLNLKNILLKLSEYDLISLILLFIILIFFFKFIIFFIKITFLKTHYYLLNDWNFKYSEKYLLFITFLVTWPKKIKYSIKISPLLIKYIFDVMLVIFFLFDILSHNYDLIFISKFLPYYSLYKLIYNILSFFYFNINLFFDNIITKALYPLRKAIENKIFGNEFSEQFLFINKYVKKITSI